MTTTLAEALPSARFSERHRLDIDGSPAQVWAALSAVQWRDLRLTAPLMMLRSLGQAQGLGERRLLDQGPVRLMRTDPPHYAAAGEIGRPWKLRPEPGPNPSSLQDLGAFAEPGWLKYGMDFTLDTAGPGRTRLTTTTQCEPTDESAARRFGAYWRLIRPFSGLIRREMLHAIARRVRQASATDLPPGQRVLIGPAPRFGLPRYRNAAITIPEEPVLHVGGQVDRGFSLDRAALDTVPQSTKALDLHCVMTWSVLGTRWTGWRFADLWDVLLRERADPGVTGILFTGLDGFTASISLAELLRDDVLVAHSRDGRPLARDHDAPYRLVVPQLYGYKNVKHLCRLDLANRHVRSPYEPWIMHRIGRVAHEERFGWGMPRLARLLNRASVRASLRRYGVPEQGFPHNPFGRSAVGW